MNPISIRPLWLGSALVAALVTVAAAAKPIATFECEESLGLEWPRMMVTYPVTFAPGQGDTNQLRLVNINGEETPFQLSRVTRDAQGKIQSGRISFFAALPAQVRSNDLFRASRYRFQLFPESPVTPPVAATVQASSNGKSLFLDNRLVAIRLPAPGEVKVDKPLSETAAPMQGVRLVDGQWVGDGKFVVADTNNQPRVTGYTCEITEQGPLFVEACVRYAFAGGEKYEFTARVIANEPVVWIDEQFDFGVSADRYRYSLQVWLAGSAWQPDVVYGLGGEWALQSEAPAYKAKLTEFGLTNNPGDSIALRFDQPSTKVVELTSRHPWGKTLQFLGLVNTAEMQREALDKQKLRFLGVAPVHPGNWRGDIASSDAMLYTTKTNTDVLLHWPLTVPPHPRNLLHTGEYDPALPLSFGRRQWALIGGSYRTADQLRLFRSYEGFVNLDDYKDWVLDWPADPKVTYPRLIANKAQWQRVKASVNNLPDPASLTNSLYFQDSPARRAHLWWGARNDIYCEYGARAMVQSVLKYPYGGKNWLTTYRYAQMSGPLAVAMDEFLSSDQIPADQRAQVRRDLAAWCYLVTEPDVNPRGSMIHLGNPSMPLNRFSGLTQSAAVIPDHPEARHWLKLAEQYSRYKLMMNTAPGGVWSELITYYNASLPHILHNALVLSEAGLFDEEYVRLSLIPATFPLPLIAPRDPRFGRRMVPAWGHEGCDSQIQFLPAAILAQRVDPALAQAFMWAWNECGRPMAGAHDSGFNRIGQIYADLIPKSKPGYLPPQIKSAWMPGFGVAMRAHAGDSNETYLSLRNGYMISHSDPNQGDFVLYSKGAPLVTGSIFGYAASGGGPFDKELEKKFGYHNRPRFGSQQNNGGWPGGGYVGGIPAHAFLDSSEYARAVGDYGSNRWTRQVAFLKGKAASGPNYFVFRDSFDSVDGDPKSKEQKWWYLRTLGTTNELQATANELIRTSAFGGGVKLTAHFLQPASITTESRQATHDGNVYYSNGQGWMDAGMPVKASKLPSHINVEETMTVTAVGPLSPEQDVLVALYPSAKGEPAPQYESLGDGAAKITTSEGTDYVFLDRKPMKFESGDVSFEGLAGAVRVYPKEIHLIISEGPGRVTYQGATLSSTQPAVKIIRPGQKGNFEIAAHKTKLKNTTLPAGCRIAGDGVCELTIEKDRIIGKSDSRGAFLYVPVPKDLATVPVLWVDGRPFAPGTTGDTLIIPLMTGEHTFEVRDIEQPPIFRNWEAW